METHPEYDNKNRADYLWSRVILITELDNLNIRLSNTEAAVLTMNQI